MQISENGPGSNLARDAAPLAIPGVSNGLRGKAKVKVETRKEMRAEIASSQLRELGRTNKPCRSKANESEIHTSPSSNPSSIARPAPHHFSSTSDRLSARTRWGTVDMSLYGGIKFGSIGDEAAAAAGSSTQDKGSDGNGAARKCLMRVSSLQRCPSLCTMCLS